MKTTNSLKFPQRRKEQAKWKHMSCEMQEASGVKLHQNCSFRHFPCVWCLLKSHAGAWTLSALLFLIVAIGTAVSCWVKAWLLMPCSFLKVHNSICCHISSYFVYHLLKLETTDSLG